MVTVKGNCVAVNVVRVKENECVPKGANSGGTTHMRPDVSNHIRLFVFREA